MKKNILLLIGLLLAISLNGQLSNTYKYPIYANGGLRIGANGDKVDSVKIDDGKIYFYSGLNVFTNDTILGVANHEKRLDTITTNYTKYLVSKEMSRYSTIQDAIDAADAGNTVVIAPGTYTITSEIVAKDGVNLYFMPGAVVTQSSNFTNAININGGDVDIYNLTLTSSSGTAGAMINVNNANVNLFNVTLNQTANFQNPLVINNSTVVGDIILNSTASTANVITIDSSTVKITSNKLHGVITTTGNTVATFNITEQIQQIDQYCDAQNESELSLYVFSQKYINQSTGEEYNLLTSKANYALVQDDASLIIEHKQLMGVVRSTDNGVINLSNSKGTYNAKVLIVNDGVATINNCNLVMDIEDTSTGVHLFEGSNAATFYVNGGYYEFSGYTGAGDTYGSLHERGNFIARNATFVNRSNTGAGYRQVFKVEGGSIELYNCNVISGTGIMAISLIGSATSPIKAVLQNNTFDVSNSFLNFNNTANSASSDTIIITGNSSKNLIGFVTILNSGFYEVRENFIIQEKSISYWLRKNYYVGDYTLSETAGGSDTLTVTITYLANAYTAKVPAIIDRMYITMYMNSSDYGGIYKLGFASRGSSGNNYRYFAIAKLTERTNSGSWVIPVMEEIASGASSTTFRIINKAAAAVTVRLQAFDMDFIASISAVTN